MTRAANTMQYKAAQHTTRHTIPRKQMPKQHQAPRKSHTHHNRKTLVTQNAKPKTRKETICATYSHIFPNWAYVGVGERFFATSAPNTPECSHKRKRDNATRCENRCWELQMPDTAAWSSLLSLVARLPYDFDPLVQPLRKKHRTHLLSAARNDADTKNKKFDFENNGSQEKGIIPEDGDLFMDTSSASLFASSLSSSSWESN